MRQYRGLTKEGKWVFGDRLTIHKKVYICSPNEVPVEIFCYDKPNGERINILSCLCTAMVEVIPETVGQQTGLKDKKGVEIDWWEGDLLKSGGGVISVITYRETYGQWCVCTTKGEGTMSLAWALNEGFEKVGTIHDKGVK